MSLKCDPGGPYLRDADTVGLIMKRGRVVIHVPDLDVHLPRDHLARQEWGASIGISLSLFLPKGSGTPPPREAGALGDTHPLVVADRELHRKLRLGLKENRGREEVRVREES